jgi:tetratricopeptide (TPR) repeat protein
MSLEKTMKTREDSLKYVDALKELDVNKYFFQIFNIYNSIGMQDKIQVLIDESLAKDPNNKTAYLVRGTLKGEKQDFKAALEDFKKVVEIDPNYVHGWFNLSKCYGNIADDIQLKKADKSGRLFGDDLKACSEAYEGAADALEHVRALDPNHETINNWPMLLRMYYNRMGKTDKAKEISKIIGDE